MTAVVPAALIPMGTGTNQLGALVEGWFGIRAGQPGTNHRVRFSSTASGWRVEPVGVEAEVIAFPSRGTVVAYRSLRAAAGRDGESTVVGEEGAEEVRLPGDFDRTRCYAVRVSGTSMDGGRDGLREGDWLIMSPSQGEGLGAVEGRVCLIARGDVDAGQTYHLKRVRKRAGGFELWSDNPDVSPMAAGPDDVVKARMKKRIRPEDLAPKMGAVCSGEALMKQFQWTEFPSGPISRVDGHLFLWLEHPHTLKPDGKLDLRVADRGPAETAFVLEAAEEDGHFRYIGGGRWVEEEGVWEV